MPKTSLSEAPTRFRGPVAKGLSPESRIEPAGGDFGAGLLRRVAILTRGEALGHEMWIDGEMLKQTYDAIVAAGDAGLKARFTHPGLSADGLGRYLGRIKHAELEGDVVYADLHLAETAHETPDGDLAAYVLRFAQEDPLAFGMSIVFQRDRSSEKRFESEHSDEENGFRSPDADNTKHYRHARLAKLHGADVVDEPAANPGGMFHRQADLAHEAEALARYALGLSDDAPAATEFDIAPERLRGFLDRFLKNAGLRIVAAGEPAESPEEPAAGDVSRETPASEPTTEAAATLAELEEACPGAEADWLLGQLRGGATLTAAREAWTAALRAQVARLEEENAHLRETEASPVSFGADEATGPVGDRRRKLSLKLGGRLASYAASLKLRPSRN